MLSAGWRINTSHAKQITNFSCGALKQITYEHNKIVVMLITCFNTLLAM